MWTFINKYYHLSQMKIVLYLFYFWLLAILKMWAVFKWSYNDNNPHCSECVYIYYPIIWTIDANLWTLPMQTPHWQIRYKMLFYVFCCRIQKWMTSRLLLSEFIYQKLWNVNYWNFHLNLLVLSTEWWNHVENTASCSITEVK